MTRRPDITPAAAAALVRRSDVRLVDVRTLEEWETGHAPGAELHPLDDLDPDKIPADRIVVIICRSGRRSGIAAEQLAGTHTVINVGGGLEAWTAEGLPVVSDTSRS
ncbi:MAG TPA: rhodanese-like domain-containing protein [Microlunatus sp.]|nr:rhodanese-like domain-containing protein [Microlunatus sp.]